ncbi:hypothetical protein BGAL_0003g00470 [Botrytis galanthina]|uniref:2EXR domain-containing protein n=1 Tax=Botrytis galanthina TaxID=278940 RepID=A0A4S8RGK4_9HELO|nr:hypothetical protein BGAL_0003g00470 [Botrytis galanthina]
MVLTRKMAKEARAAAQPPATFHAFSLLPTELRTMVWNAAENSRPGRLIEVYNIPNHYTITGRPTSFEWHARPCGCEKRCFEPPLARVNHESRNIALQRRSKCFGQWVDWDKDMIFIGSRVGHLHNTGFLHALEVQNCREKLKYLAIDFDCWEKSSIFPCTRKAECTPAAMISRLPGLQKVVLAQASGAWRDGNEFEAHDPGHYHNIWRSFDTSDALMKRGFDDLVRSEKAEHAKWILQSYYKGIDVRKAFPEEVDKWRCYDDSHEEIGENPGSYKSEYEFVNEYNYHHGGSCGTALIQFEKIENAYWWGTDDDQDDYRFLRDWIQENIDKLKSISEKKFHGDPDYNTWKQPEIEYALIRRTAPSCFTDDCEGLEREWMFYGEAAWARDHPKSYRARDKSKDYPAGQHVEKYTKLYPASERWRLDG